MVQYDFSILSWNLFFLLVIRPFIIYMVSISETKKLSAMKINNILVFRIRFGFSLICTPAFLSCHGVNLDIKISPTMRDNLSLFKGISLITLHFIISMSESIYEETLEAKGLLLWHSIVWLYKLYTSRPVL